jgi:hypothetical protein
MSIKKEPLIIHTDMIKSRFWSALEYPFPEYFEQDLHQIGELSKKLDTNNKLLLDNMVYYAVIPCVCYEINSFKNYYDDKRI